MADKRAKIIWFDEAAGRFKVTPDTLREWIAEGRFPAPRGHGNRLFYTQAELDDIVEHDFLGRWKPAPTTSSESGTAGRSRKEPGKRGKEPGKGVEEQGLEGTED